MNDRDSPMKTRRFHRKTDRRSGHAPFESLLLIMLIGVVLFVLGFGVQLARNNVEDPLAACAWCIGFPVSFFATWLAVLTIGAAIASRKNLRKTFSDSFLGLFPASILIVWVGVVICFVAGLASKLFSALIS